MLKGILNSVVLVPVLFGVVAAMSRRGRGGLMPLIAVVLAFDLCYIVLMYYLRYRWVG